eukprot:14693558-Ditylum_brightwellii.AAC.1
MRNAHLLGREDDLKGENREWHHSLSQTERIIHNALKNQAFVHNNSSGPQMRKADTHPPHLIFP